MLSKVKNKIKKNDEERNVKVGVASAALSDCSYVDEWKLTIFLARRTKLRNQNSVFSPLNFWLSFTLPKFYINSMMYSFFSDFILLPLSAVRKLLQLCTSSKVYKILFPLYHFRIQDHCLQFYLVSFDMSYFFNCESFSYKYIFILKRLQSIYFDILIVCISLTSLIVKQNELKIFSSKIHLSFIFYWRF